MRSGYTRTPRHLMDHLVESSTVTRSLAFLDLVSLAEWQGPHVGEVHWSKRKLAQRWRVSRRTVGRWLDQLCDEGLVSLGVDDMSQSGRIISATEGGGAQVSAQGLRPGVGTVITINDYNDLYGRSEGGVPIDGAQKPPTHHQRSKEDPPSVSLERDISPPLDQSNPTNGAAADQGLIRRVFDTWRAAFDLNGHTQLTPHRLQAIRSRLTDSTPEEIYQAIDRAARSEWHRERGHIDLARHILPGRDKLEWWLHRPENPPPEGAASGGPPERRSPAITPGLLKCAGFSSEAELDAYMASLEATNEAVTAEGTPS